jgi:hypothetical protein
MRIVKHNGGRNEGILRPGEDTSYTIALSGHENPNFIHILEGWLDALELHELKSQDYSERDEPGAVWSLGLMGEWPGFTRKIQKLHKIIWKGKDVLFEGGQEIIMDCMGALGLMLHEQRLIKDRYSASWRDNHGNKPTFGPGPRDVEPMTIGPGGVVEIDSPPDDAWMRSLPKHDEEMVEKPGGTYQPLTGRDRNPGY